MQSEEGNSSRKKKVHNGLEWTHTNIPSPTARVISLALRFTRETIPAF
jgi:hypothetical protein